MKATLCLPVLCLMVLTAVAALPLINRPAQLDGWGYRPTDGSPAVMIPPSFKWIHDKRAVSYDVQWAHTPDFTAASQAPGVP